MFSKTVALYMGNNFLWEGDSWPLQQSVLLQDNSASSAINNVCLCCPSRSCAALGQVMFPAFYLHILSVSFHVSRNNRCFFLPSTHADLFDWWGNFASAGSSKYKSVQNVCFQTQMWAGDCYHNLFARVLWVWISFSLVLHARLLC